MNALALKNHWHKTGQLHYHASSSSHLDNSMDALISSDDDADALWHKKLLHYCHWCIHNQTGFTFEQLIYDDVKPHIIRSRKVELTYKSQEHVVIDIDRAEPSDDRIFGNHFDRSFLNAMEDVLLISEAEPFDLPGPRVIFVNQAFEKMTGYHESEIIGQTPRILQCDNTKKESRREIRQGLDSWAPFKVVLRNQTKAGVEFDVELSISPVADETGWYTHWISIQRDITAREQMLTELAQANVILKSVQMGTWSIYPDSHTFYWDENCNQLHGGSLSHAPPLLDTWVSLATTSSRESFKENLFRIVATLPESFDIHYEREVNNEIRHIKLTGRVTFAEDGRTRLVGVAEDITQQHVTDEKLSEALLRLNETVAAGKIGMWDWDLVTNQTHYSKEYKNQIGYEEDEIEDDFSEFESRVHPDDLEALLEKVKNSIDNCSENHETEFRFRHKDGSYRWIWAHASVIKNEFGEPVRMVGSHIDVTNQKQLEAQLRQSQKMEAIGQLAGGVAHDFNNHLASIIGFSELLEAKLDDPVMQGYLQKILSAAEGSSKLTNQLLTYSRQNDIALEQIDIHEQIYEILSILSHSVDKRIELHTDLEATDCVVMGDKALLQSAFLNLALNAKDAMPEGGKLCINTTNTDFDKETSNGEASRRFIKVCVTDTGVGISHSDIQKIYDPFFTTKNIGEGTGLGLATTFSAIAQLNGTIDVESTPGEGTQFAINLPTASKAERATDNKSENDFETQTSNSKSILVVDDEPLIREMLQLTLELMEHQCLFAENGKRALELYKQEQANIDLVILDMNMPIMGGRDTFIALKKMNPDIKVLISSGYHADHSNAELIADGVAGIINKPYKFADIKQAIEALF